MDPGERGAEAALINKTTAVGASAGARDKISAAFMAL